MASPVLVTGGTGRLGKLVVARLRRKGCDVRVLARRDRPTPPGVTFFTADLRTDQGIEPAVTAAAAIIHCATSTRGDAEATRNLVAAASRTGSAHLVYVSIVGIDRIASWGGQPSSPKGVAGSDTGHPCGPQRRSAATAGTHRRFPDLGPVPYHPAAASRRHRLAGIGPVHVEMPGRLREPPLVRVT